MLIFFCQKFNSAIFITFYCDNDDHSDYNYNDEDDLRMMMISHLDSLHLDAPRIGRFVQRRLHPVRDLLPKKTLQS